MMNSVNDSCRSWSAVLFLALVTPFHPSEANAQATAAARPRVGVALGGGSARGLAHVGVLRWLEEHRIPIDVVAGTSMGGLIGGSYATGMSPDEVEAMLADIDWTTMFDSSDFPFQSVRRKRDSRAYPGYIEFGLKGGFSAQTSLNGGQQVDLLLHRVTAPYYMLERFDQLPTPFRCVAFNLLTAERVVLDRGSLARALRATMSLPAVFPPVAMNNQVLVDGGVADNVPADVVRDMGAAVVIAVNVGDLTARKQITGSMLGIASSTMDAMMRANTVKGMAAADVVINVPLDKYGSLDWRRFRDLIREGYDATEAMRGELLPHAVDEATWESWRASRAAARRRSLPAPTFLDIEGAGSVDTGLMRRELADQVGRPLDVAALEADLIELGGLGRYESLTWEIVERNGAQGLLVRALPKAYAPPFLFLGVSLEDTTSNSFRFGLSGRYLAFDVAGSGSELRIDAAVGSDPSAAVALYRPIGSTALFVEPLAGVASSTLNVVESHTIIATYHQSRAMLGADVGANLGRINEVRAGLHWGHIDTEVRVGSPNLPSLSGEQSIARLDWTHDSQDNPIVPSRGVHSVAELRHYLSSPMPDVETDRSTDGVTQFEAGMSWAWSLDRGARNRLFAIGGAGSSFGDRPLPTEQFALGGPFQLSALDGGERRGDNFVLTTGGYLRQVARLPDFMGGAVLAGGWLEFGSAFDDWDTATFDTNASVGMIAETLLGPVFVGGSAGSGGASRFYVGIGRIFR
jgi:NTE family protein